MDKDETGQVWAPGGSDHGLTKHSGSGCALHNTREPIHLGGHNCQQPCSLPVDLRDLSSKRGQDIPALRGHLLSAKVGRGDVAEAGAGGRKEIR